MNEPTGTLERRLGRRVGGEMVRFGEPLRDHVTYRVGGPARIFLRPRTTEEATRALGAVSALGLPVRFLGGGSNVLPDPAGFDGAVVCTRGLREVTRLPALPGLTVGAGASLMHVIREAQRASLSGIETLAGIPGSVGGAVTMNTGGPAGTPSMGDVVTRALVIEPGRAAPRWLDRDALCFRYRGSGVLDGGLLVLAAEVGLRPDDPRAITERIVGSTLKKRSSQPIWCRSAGCTFKNPPAPLPGAGALIDRAGCKGLRVGGAQVSPVHANFLVNDEHATAEDVLALIAEVQRRVKEKFGVRLELEVRRF